MSKNLTQNSGEIKSQSGNILPNVSSAFPSRQSQRNESYSIDLEGIDVMVGEMSQKINLEGIDVASLRTMAGAVFEEAKKSKSAAGFKQALEWLDLAIKKEPNAKWLHFDRGLCKAGLGRYEEAVLDFTAELKLHKDGPGVYRSYYERGWCYEQMQDSEKSRKDFDASLAANADESVRKAINAAIDSALKFKKKTRDFLEMRDLLSESLFSYNPLTTSERKSQFFYKLDEMKERGFDSSRFDGVVEKIIKTSPDLTDQDKSLLYVTRSKFRLLMRHPFESEKIESDLNAAQEFDKNHALSEVISDQYFFLQELRVLDFIQKMPENVRYYANQLYNNFFPQPVAPNPNPNPEGGQNLQGQQPGVLRNR